LEAVLKSARSALAALETRDRSVAGIVQRVGELRYAEGRLVGFLDALLVADPAAAEAARPSIETFISEAIAAQLLLD